MGCIAMIDSSPLQHGVPETLRWVGIAARDTKTPVLKPNAPSNSAAE